MAVLQPIKLETQICRPFKVQTVALDVCQKQLCNYRKKKIIIDKMYLLVECILIFCIRQRIGATSNRGGKCIHFLTLSLSLYTESNRLRQVALSTFLPAFECCWLHHQYVWLTDQLITSKYFRFPLSIRWLNDFLENANCFGLIRYAIYAALEQTMPNYNQNSISDTIHRWMNVLSRSRALKYR